MKLAALVLGLVLFIEGLPYLASPAAVKRMMAEVHELDNRVLRIMGFIAMSCGLLLVWLGA